MSDPSNPTGRELEIMQVLWDRGPSTVREVVEVLNEARNEPFAYTTILRFFQIMFEKGLVVRDESNRTHVYSPAAPAQQTKRQMVSDLVKRVFAGSPRELVLHLLGDEKPTKEALDEIRDALSELEDQSQTKS
ncbi:MAG: BlaI/MecI/CopY family transcriptional regulator [Verrucomicrobiota bacterium]